MRTLNLDSAISEIVDACASNREKNGGSPFFFIAGSGIASPIIPLARDIREECQAHACKMGRSSRPPAQDPMSKYSHWFEAAYPHSEQRQEYLQKKIQGKAISPASLRLAHLLHDGQVAQLLVTPNFDDFVSRALALFGEPAIVCDHPGTVRRLNLHSPQRQILHVHGTYWFYDCCNLTGEIAQRASEHDISGLPTVLSFLSNLLWHHSPIVIGYKIAFRGPDPAVQHVLVLLRTNGRRYPATLADESRQCPDRGSGCGSFTEGSAINSFRVRC